MEGNSGMVTVHLGFFWFYLINCYYVGFQFFNSLFKFILLVPCMVSIGIKTQNVAYVIKIIFY